MSLALIYKLVRIRVGFGQELFKQPPPYPGKLREGRDRQRAPQEESGSWPWYAQPSLAWAEKAMTGRSNEWLCLEALGSPAWIWDPPLLAGRLLSWILLSSGTYSCGFIGAGSAGSNTPSSPRPAANGTGTNFLTLFGDGYSWVDNTDYVVIA
uniref:Uncharacterized protein n=1 Tax=Sphaerodactylus townsendi TaxID=933632 RepID=A0ACB8F3B1_9SAUR